MDPTPSHWEALSFSCSIRRATLQRVQVLRDKDPDGFELRRCIWYILKLISTDKYSGTCIADTHGTLASIRLLQGVRLIQVLVNCAMIFNY